MSIVNEAPGVELMEKTGKTVEKTGKMCKTPRGIIPLSKTTLFQI
jgi:hypothetical protein